MPSFFLTTGSMFRYNLAFNKVLGVLRGIYMHFTKTFHITHTILTPLYGLCLSIYRPSFALKH